MNLVSLIVLAMLCFSAGMLVEFVIENTSAEKEQTYKRVIDIKGQIYDVLSEDVIHEGQLEHFVLYRSVSGRRITYCCSKKDFYKTVTNRQGEEYPRFTKI